MNQPQMLNAAWLDLLQLNSDGPGESGAASSCESSASGGDPAGDLSAHSALAILGDLSVVDDVRSSLSESAVRWGAVIAVDVAESVSRERAQEMLEGHAGDTGLEGAASAAAVLTTLACLKTGATHPDAPPETLRHVRAAFRQGAELSSILRFVWAHHAQVEERLLLAQRELAPQEQDGAGLQDLHMRMNLILDSYVSGMVAAYEDERAGWEGGSPARRRRLIDLLMAGEDLPADAEGLLGIRLGGHHLVAVAGSARGMMSDRQLESVKALGSAGAAVLDASRWFAQDYGDAVLLCWSFSDPPADGTARTLALIDLPPWLLLSIGPVAPGVDGLRFGIQGALEARDIARHPGRGPVSGKRADIVTYDAVGVVALMLRDEPRLIGFVKATLGDLAKRSPRNEEVRSTLLAFLLHGRSRKKAAEILHVAPNTVAYRVEQAQSLMTRNPDSDILATILALRVLEILPNLDEAFDARTDGAGGK